MTTSHDIIIIGGGVMGSAIATYLLRDDPSLDLVVVERAPSYERASTTLSDGNTRLQFNLKENIQISLYGLEVLANFAEAMAVDGHRPDVAFRRQGNLFLVDEAGEAEAREALALQRALGGDVSWLTPDALQQHYPLLDVTGFVGGTLGHQDGTMSPLALLLAYRNKAISLGASYLKAEVDRPLAEAGRIRGVSLKDRTVLSAPVVVNAAGAWAAQLAERVGVMLPVAPIKRQVTIFNSPVAVDGVLPLLFFPSGLYVVHERQGTFTCGRSFADDPHTLDDFSWERKRFEQRLWPELAEAIPAFDRLKVNSGWAGLYAVNTLDGNAILGEWPLLKGFYLANGFSGHGFQQCHAVGRYIAELILDRSPALDLSIFSPQRILDNTPVFESKRRII